MSQIVLRRNVVQIGLHNSASYIHLARNGWIDLHKTLDKLLQLPKHFMDNPAPFNFYGVDCSPESIQHCASAYSDHERVKFLCAGVSDSFYCNWELAEPFDWHRLEINTNVGYLMIPMKELPRILGIQHIDILAVDIDGYEHLIFKEMCDWEVFPLYITVELHGFHVPEHRRSISDRDACYLFPVLVETICDCGYKLHNHFKKDEGVQEAQFIRTNAN